MRLNRINWLLILTLVIAIFLRVPSIGHGLPTITHPDEPDIIITSMGIAQDPNPHRFVWPASTIFYLLFFTFGAYFLFGRLFGVFPSLQAFKEFYLLDSSSFYLLGRIIVLIFGIASILILYLVAKNLYGRKTALLSSFFLTFFLLHIKYSTLALTDMPMIFFLLLSLLFIIKLYQKGNLKYYILSGIFIGLTIASKYTGGAILFTFLLAHFLRKPRKFLDKRLFLGIILIPITFIIATPFSVLSFNEFLKQLNWVFFKGFTSEQVGSFVPYTSYLYSFTLIREEIGLLFLVLSATGLLFILFKHKEKRLILLSFPLIYYLFIGNLKILSSQYILPIVIFFPIFISVFIVHILSRLSMNKKFFLSLLALIIIIPSTISIIEFHKYQSLQDTRDISLKWIEENIPFDTTFAYESYTPLLPQNKASLLNELEKCEQLKTNCESAKLFIKQNNPGYNIFKIGYVWNPVSEEMTKDFKRYFQDREIDYILTSSYQSERFFRKETQKISPEVARRSIAYYTWLDEENILVKEFKPNSKSKGPLIKMYRFDP